MELYHKEMEESKNHKETPLKGTPPRNMISGQILGK